MGSTVDITGDYRKGNILRDRLTGSWLRVIEVDELNIVTSVIDRSKFPLPDGWSIEPIPLTRSLLESFGFVKRSEAGNLFDLEKFKEVTKDAANRGQGFVCIADFKEKYGFYLDLQSRRTVRYLHELQNLLWGITGFEYITVI